MVVKVRDINSLMIISLVCKKKLCLDYCDALTKGFDGPHCLMTQLASYGCKRLSIILLL